MTQKIEVYEYLKDFPKNETLYFHPNPGNAGDSLIACATFQLFDKGQIKHEIVSNALFDPRGKTVVYGGGGNLVSQYSTARDFLKSVHALAKRLIMFPHTICGNEDLLGAFGRNVSIFCREEVTYQHVRKHANNAEVMLANDMAFSLDVPAIFSSDQAALGAIFLKKAGTFFGIKLDKEELPKMRSLLCFVKQNARWSFLGGARTGRLNAFREDGEKTKGKPPLDNIDVSGAFAFGTKTRALADLAAFHFLKFLNRFESIYTNRLHCAIGAALLGKQVYLYKNNYYKVEAVWRFSMKQKFPNVHWSNDRWEGTRSRAYVMPPH